MFLGIICEREISTLDLLLKGFWCPQCDIRDLHAKEQISNVIHMPKSQNNTENRLDFTKLQSLFFQFLYEVTSEELVISCVHVLPRILRHASRDALLETKVQWIECINFLLLHKLKAVREAFCAEINCFLQDHIQDVLFMDGEASGKTKVQKFLDKIKHALEVSEDPQILLTLLETTAEIMNASGIHEECFLSSFIMLINQLDNQHQAVRLTALRFIQRSCYCSSKGGFELIFSRYFHIRDEIYEYLCARLASRPIMIKEFAEAVIGIKTEELVKKMVPFVIPKLVVSQKVDNQAIIILTELANHLSTEVVPLIVNWLPKVLAFALLHEDGQELSSALQFYQAETGSDNKEIFEAALPALLDELLCFPVEADLDKTDRR